jgi:hypothetical protein
VTTGGLQQRPTRTISRLLLWLLVDCGETIRAGVESWAMTTNTAAFVELPAGLRCPECTAAFHFSPSPRQPLPGGTFGVLSCGPHAYPVVDSIPVIRTGRIDVQDHLTGRADVSGPSVEELLYRVRVDPLEALVDLLTEQCLKSVDRPVEGVPSR